MKECSGLQKKKTAMGNILICVEKITVNYPTFCIDICWYKLLKKTQPAIETKEKEKVPVVYWRPENFILYLNKTKYYFFS